MTPAAILTQVPMPDPRVSPSEAGRAWLTRARLRHWTLDDWSRLSEPEGVAA